MRATIARLAPTLLANAAGAVIGIFLMGLYMAAMQSANPGQTFVQLAPSLVALAAIVGNGYAAWLVMRGKAQEDASLEQIRAELKQFGDARHLRTQAVYQQQFESVVRLLRAQAAMQTYLRSVREFAMMIDDEHFEVNVVLSLAQANEDRAEGLVLELHRATDEGLIWIADDLRPAVSGFDAAISQIGWQVRPRLDIDPEPDMRAQIRGIEGWALLALKHFQVAQEGLRRMIDAE